MFNENEDSIMKAPGICSDKSSCWHSSVSSTRGKKSCSHVKSLHWPHTQLLLVLLVAGHVSCNQSSTTPTSVSVANVQTPVNYFFDISVNVNVEKDESEITAWLKEVLQNNLQSCVSSTTAAPASPQTTATTSTTLTNSRATTTATSTNQVTSTSMVTTSTATTSTAAKSTATTSTAATSMAATSTATTSTAAKSTVATSTATTSTATTSTAAKSTVATSTATTSTATTSTAATSTATTSTAAKSTTATSPAAKTTVVTSTATTSTSRKSPATTSKSTTELKISSTTLAATFTAPKDTSTTKASATKLKTSKAASTALNPLKKTTPTPTIEPGGEVIQQALTKPVGQTSFAEVTVVPGEKENGRETKAPNANQPIKQRVAREVNERATQTSDGQTTGILQELTASCSKKTAIRNTNCSVTLSVNQGVSPCCILRTLCEASKQSSDFNVVGRRINIINDLQNECNSDPQKENSCVYTGGAIQSCEASEFMIPQSHQCNTGKTCGCSSYCSGTNAYYAFEISIQNPEISFTQVSSLISKLKDTPECSTSTDGLCPSPSIAAQYQGFSLSCGSTTTNLGNCRVVVNFTSAIAICEVADAVLYVLQVEKQIRFKRPVTSAAICGNSEVSLQETVLTWKIVNLKPADFCPALEGTSGIACENGETLLVLLNQQCDLQVTTVAPNVTTIQPNTTLSVNVTTTPLNTTTNVTVPHNTTTTPANAEAQANALLELTKDVSKLNSSQISQLVSQLERLLSGPNVSLALGNTSVQIVSNLLGASPDVLSDSSTRIIGLVDTVGLKLVLEEAEETLLSPDVALSVKPADGTNFQETVFSILNPSDVQLRGGSRRSRSVRADSSIPQGSIKLPPSLTQNLSAEQQQLVSRVQFNFYQKSTVFQDRSLGQRRLISGILGASVSNMSISNLQDNVVINLRNTEPIPANFVASCVFWDFNLNDGSGGWNPNGCSVQNSTDDETVCGCNHLTSFAILLDLSREPLTSRVQATILTFITYIGCGISAIFLAITLLTYLAFGKLRKDIPSKILIQLCLALLLLNLVFLVDAWLALYPDAVGLCISTAWFLHYFLLVSFTWMGLEAVHMYLALVKVFNSYVSRYMLKFSLVGWGVPMIVVIIVIAIDKNNYGLVSYGRFTDGTSDDFCWIKNDIAFYVAVVAYFCVIFLFNLVMFVVVLVQLCRIKRQNPHNSNHRTTLQDVRSVVGITILLGLTWGFAFFAWGPVNLAFMYLFAIFNSLYGFFIFVFHCAVKENVRRQWRTYLCCGRMRLAENSDWSRTATQKTMKKSSVTRQTPERCSKHSNNSSSSFLVSDSSEHLNGISSPFEDRAITADEEPSRDVIVNEINRQRRSHRAS